MEERRRKRGPAATSSVSNDQRGLDELVKQHWAAIRAHLSDADCERLEIVLDALPGYFPDLPADRAVRARAAILAAAIEALRWTVKPPPGRSEARNAMPPRHDEVRDAIARIGKATREWRDAVDTLLDRGSLLDLVWHLLGPLFVVDRLLSLVEIRAGRSLDRLALPPDDPNAIRLQKKGPLPRNVPAQILVECLAQAWESLTGERPPPTNRRGAPTSFEELALQVGSAIGLHVTSHVIREVERMRRARFGRTDEVAQQ